MTRSAAAGSQWTAEVEVTPQLAADLIREQFPDLGARRVTVLATGWDNTAFLAEGQWLFRFPRREVAVPGVRREIAVLPRLAARSIAYLGFAGKARADLLSAYGRPVSAEQELAARACAISLAASLVEYAAAEGRAPLLQECAAGLRRAVAA